MKFKLLYVKKDPFGAPACKIGITGSPEVRLGVYQNSYYHGSHTATFDHVFVGNSKNINNLEKTLKQQFGLAIQKEGRGHSEWVSEPVETVLKQISDTIEGYRFNAFCLNEPVTVYNLEHALTRCEQIMEDNG